MNLIEHFRQKIRCMTFQPLNDEEVTTVKKQQQEAIINARLECLYFSDEQLNFLSMLIEERVPNHIREEIVDEWLKLSI